MIRRPAATALILALAVSTAAAAQGPAKPSDLTCMLVANGIGGSSKDAKQREMASLMMIFYLGRVDGRTPNLNLAPALRAEGERTQTSKPTPAQIQAQVQSCVTTFNGRMNALGALTKPAAPAAGATAPATPAPK